MSSQPNPQPAPPLDLAQFEGFTPGPWRASFDNDFVESDEGAICEVMPQDMAGDDGEVSEDESRARELNNLELLCAAPALLAECIRLRAELNDARALLMEASASWNDPTSASVQRRCANMEAIRVYLRYETVEHHP